MRAAAQVRSDRNGSGNRARWCAGPRLRRSERRTLVPNANALPALAKNFWHARSGAGAVGPQWVWQSRTLVRRAQTQAQRTSHSRSECECAFSSDRSLRSGVRAAGQRAVGPQRRSGNGSSAHAGAQGPNSGAANVALSFRMRMRFQLWRKFSGMRAAAQVRSDRNGSGNRARWCAGPKLRRSERRTLVPNANALPALAKNSWHARSGAGAVGPQWVGQSRTLVRRAQTQAQRTSHCRSECECAFTSNKKTSGMRAAGAGAVGPQWVWQSRTLVRRAQTQAQRTSHSRSKCVCASSSGQKSSGVRAAGQVRSDRNGVCAGQSRTLVRRAQTQAQRTSHAGAQGPNSGAANVAFSFQTRMRFQL